MTKILIINGSPRRNGNVTGLLMEMARECGKNGCEVMYKRVTDLNIAPCSGCMACRTSRYCAMSPDDSLRVIEMLRDADALIIGAPCYWNNIPGPVKTMFDRMVYALMELDSHGIPRGLHKGKKAIIVATATTPRPFHRIAATRGVVRSIKTILSAAGIKVSGTIHKGSTARSSAPTPHELDAARRLTRKLINQFH